VDFREGREGGVTLGNIREKYERSTVPIGKALARIGLTPNMMTISSILISLLSLYYFYHKNLLYAFIIIVIAGILDIMDGAIARATGRVSKFGTLLDNTADRVVEGIAILGLVIGGYIYGWIGVLTIMAMYLPSYIRARGEAELNINARGVGIFERKEKLGLLFGGMILLVLGVEYVFDLYITSLDLMNMICILIALGSIISSIQRLLYFKNQAKT